MVLAGKTEVKAAALTAVWVDFDHAMMLIDNLSSHHQTHTSLSTTQILLSSEKRFKDFVALIGRDTRATIGNGHKYPIMFDSSTDSDQTLLTIGTVDGVHGVIDELLE
jgi:hypothetical protein